MHITNGHFRISLCFGVGLAGHCGHKGHFIHHGTNFKQSGCKSMILDLLALTLFMLEKIFILGSYPFENLIFHIER